MAKTIESACASERASPRTSLMLRTVVVFFVVVDAVAFPLPRVVDGNQLLVSVNSVPETQEMVTSLHR